MAVRGEEDGQKSEEEVGQRPAEGWRERTTEEGELEPKEREWRWEEGNGD